MADNDETTAGIIREVPEAEHTTGYTVGTCDGCDAEPIITWDYIGDLLCEECCAIAWDDDDNDDLMEAE